MEQLGWFYLTIFSRIVGALIWVPGLGGATVPRRVRVGASAVFALLVSFTLGGVGGASLNSASPQSVTTAAAILGAEFFVGAMMGVCVAVFFAALTMAGELVGRLGGFSVAASFDPASGGESNSLSTLGMFLGIAVFFLAGGAEQFLGGLLDSFVILPPGGALERILSVETVQRFTETLLVLSTGAMAMTLRIASPVVFASLTIWLAVGVLARTGIGQNLLSAGMTVNGLGTLTVLCATLGATMIIFQQGLAAAIACGVDLFTAHGG